MLIQSTNRDNTCLPAGTLCGSTALLYAKEAHMRQALPARRAGFACEMKWLYAGEALVFKMRLIPRLRALPLRIAAMLPVLSGGFLRALPLRIAATLPVLSGGFLRALLLRIAAMLLVLSGGFLQARCQSAADTIFTTRGAVTLISCGSAITTLQIGDGKNTDYDYRVVDGNLVFIRPLVANPRVTNLVVREGENVHYLILAYEDKADLSRLKYTLSSNTSAKNTASPVTAAGGGSPGNAVRAAADAPAPDVKIDTVTVSRIAEDFARQRKGGHQYEVKAEGITLSFMNAMSLNNLVYFCYRIRNRSGQPYAIARATLMYKESKDSMLQAMPVVYKKEPAAIGGREEQQVVYVVQGRAFDKKDEVILVLQNNENQDQLMLYTPVSALPKYMYGR